MKDTEKVEIDAIASRLNQLARNAALRDDFQVACLQGADLLKMMRRIVIGKRQSDTAIANQLRELLSKQGEG